MGYGSFAYQVVYLIHLACVVVGFGSSFVYPVLAVKARKLPMREAFAVNHTALEVSPFLTSYPIYGAGAAGLVLIVLSDELYTFSQTWISAAFALYILALLVALFLHSPNLKAMDALQAKLVDGPELPAGSPPPPEVAEIEERGQKAAMYGGILHLFWLALMIDMIWKPGLGY
jgi:Zn-dependent protease with chaperone function